MKYWLVAKDIGGNGKMGEPGDNMANYVWTHLFIYKDLEGTVPEDWRTTKRLHVGKDIQGADRLGAHRQEHIRRKSLLFRRQGW